MKRPSAVLGDALLGIVFSALIVLVLVVIGNIQANQYRQIVGRIDSNTQAIVCILLISPAQRTDANVSRCLATAGVPIDRITRGGKP